MDAQAGAAVGETPAVSVKLQQHLERKNDLLLHTERRRHKCAEWNKEVWILPAAPQLVLKEEQTLKCDLLCNTIFKANVMRANVYAAACTKVIVSKLRDESVRTFDRKYVEKRSVTPLCDPSDL